MAFGQVIANARKKVGLSQKELAAKIIKEDGIAISPQYLNDIEHDRRNPPGEFILDQLAKELNLELDYLHYLAGILPEDILKDNLEPEQVKAAFRAFRRTLQGKLADGEMDS